MNLKDKISAFSALGSFLRAFHVGESATGGSMEEKLDQAITLSFQYNPWFTPSQISFALKHIGLQLQQDQLEQWLSDYQENIANVQHPRKVGIVMAGNIPAVGFHDLLCVLMSGHQALVKLSSNDRFLIPFVADFLITFDKRFSALIDIIDKPLSGFDAVIATGSNNTSRYFESYFSKVPHIIRKNRNSVAVLSGKEGAEDLSNLCEDIFRYFGLGCRNVSRLFVPVGYSFDDLLKASEAYSEFAFHHKYASNYIYYQTIFLMNGQRFCDNGILLLKKENAYGSPVSVVYYTEYADIKEVNNQLLHDSDQLQCILSNIPEIAGAKPFGTSQIPSLHDYADGVDTMAFLGELTNFITGKKTLSND